MRGLDEIVKINEEACLSYNVQEDKKQMPLESRGRHWVVLAGLVGFLCFIFSASFHR